MDKEFLNIIDDILKNDQVLKLKNCEHHGITRFEHSMRVAYNSYKIAKKLNLNYKSVARAGLLHDFFLNENVTFKDKLISYFRHPLIALKNANDNFNLNLMEQDIIKSHMFPVFPTIPRYKESWLVSICDKIVASYEFFFKFGYKLRYVSNLTFLLLFNIIK